MIISQLYYQIIFKYYNKDGAGSGTSYYLIHPSSHSTEGIAPNKAYLWSRSKCWMRARKANIQHAATKITNMPYWGQWLRL